MPDDEKNILGPQSDPNEPPPEESPEEQSTLEKIEGMENAALASQENDPSAFAWLVSKSFELQPRVLLGKFALVAQEEGIGAAVADTAETVTETADVIVLANKEGDLTSAVQQNAANQVTALASEQAALEQGIEYVPESTEEMSQRTRFAEQCYLMYNLTELAKYHKNSMKDPASVPVNATPLPLYSYRKTHLLDTQQGSTVIPKLTMRPGTEYLMDARPSVLAELVPKLSLYKEYYKDEEDETVIDCEVPFKFYNHTITSEDVLNDMGETVDEPAQNRTAVGIKSFDWNYISSNPETIRNDITAKLVLYFQDMEELFKARKHDVITGEGDDAQVDT